MMRHLLLVALSLVLAAQTPKVTPTGAELPNGWKLTPVGRHTATSDYVLNVQQAPDGKALVGLHSGFNPHGLAVVDPVTSEVVQRIPQKSAWFGMAWSPDGMRLYVSGGNGNSRREPAPSPVYAYTYSNGRLSDKPVQEYSHRMAANQIYWSGLVHHPTKPILYAANRHTERATPGHVVAFDTQTGNRITEIQVEVAPYDLILDASAKRLFVSNWASRSISVIDLDTNRVTATIAVGHNPNDMVLAPDGRLFVACGNENSVYVIDTRKLRAVEKINTAMHPQAPVGSTPNALALDPTAKFLFVANADNNNVAVLHVGDEEESNVMGFIPSPWYPSALQVSRDGKFLFVGTSKGMGGYSNERGPHSPLAVSGEEGKGSVKSLQRGSIGVVPLTNLKSQIKEWTRQAMANSPYNDDLLSRAKAPTAGPTIVPSQVGAGSPIKHVIYIVKENRTYDQVFGDIAKGNGDPRITIFGRDVTPNHHKIAEEFVLLDNLYCDGEVSVDGHSWSNSAYATDFNEKLWPPNYGGHSSAMPTAAHAPSSGQLWDLAARKGLTYRSYGEYAQRVSDGGRQYMDAASGVGGLVGHVSPNFKLPGMRDTDNAKAFIAEFDEFEKNYDSTDANKRLPNYSVMSLGENHTVGTTPGRPTPRAAVASNDYALGMIVDRVTRSRYWKETAIFVIEDDAQDGSDHVDARRTIGLIVSPYTKRKAVDSTLYTTSSMLRTMELLLGLPPMTQYDAAATPMYASFSDKADMTPYTHEKPRIDINQLNSERAWGAGASLAMDFSEYDRTPMFALNEIIWKSIKGADSEMPLPVRRFHFRK
ncbi:MAG: beta-propeller fold lactonase family protein [Bryobacterales bacterium]|nr:beta-propeller fold lactonase family protein [Bryobacterales bacterium]